MDQEVKLVVLIDVQAGKAEQQIRLFNNLKPLVLEEEGCFEYELHRVTDNEDQLVLTERWSSEAAWKAHHETPHMKEASKLTPSFRAGPTKVLRLDLV
ncbi:putative quinol monooxygenase [Marinomonas pollencensis]|uniref:Quinol monooxygenase YgiN n=1 Tax=Marinomonas pollencensis TaxID=491954 RepID=A0A3E0DHW1_9GAMM|nr:antibiotic biosynthesis monooxygenase family protein [Marinomonas pollencensis]REG81599.1 quinol monooxygenase YgiN [Marinomonas pollencensis]